MYTGYTQDIEKRIDQHNSGSKGARYTRTRRPVKLVYYEIFKKQREAMKRERAIKSLSRTQKLELVRNFIRNNEKTNFKKVDCD